jgi:hypothetical protein
MGQGKVILSGFCCVALLYALFATQPFVAATGSTKILRGVLRGWLGSLCA